MWAGLTTVFHEGVPGLHLQLGQLRVQGGRLSRFSRLSGVSGHSEGWALYAERLADELGWHTTPGSRLGMLKGSALRAARVVIDIGVHLDLPVPDREAERHGPRWSFETAIEVLRDRGRIAAHRLHPEVVRYCGWPAQATAYKLGERAWLAARDEARARSGPGFDLKRWHTDGGYSLGAARAYRLAGDGFVEGGVTESFPGLLPGDVRARLHVLHDDDPLAVVGVQPPGQHGCVDRSEVDRVPQIPPRVRRAQRRLDLAGSDGGSHRMC